jgi:nickel/cobalt transporter (NicO) family protein
MRKLLVVLLGAAALLVPATADAHPLGNFTVNRYSGIELSGAQVYVHYVLDLAEIPTLQEGSAVRSPGFADRVAKRLVLEAGGGRLPLVPVEQRLRERPGAGGLATLRFEAVYRSAAGSAGGTLSFRDTNFARRLGWKEVVVHASDGARVLSSSVPAESVSDALRAYPSDLLSSPPDVTSARVAYEPGSGPGTEPSLDADPVATEPKAGGFESLIARDELGLGVVMVSVLVAMFWGAAHALTPGHGKAIVAAYMVGTRGTARHALLLGGIVTVTHTLGVFALGVVTLTLSEFVVPEQLYPWMNLAAAVLVVLLGIAVLRLRLRRPGGHDHHHHHHDTRDHNHHHHHHDREHGHSHVPEQGSGLRGLVAVGISGGLLPCPSALVVLLAAISLHRVGYGLLLIVAFSVGLAATIAGIGLLAVTARRAFNRMSFQGPLIRMLPVASALVIIALGVAMTLRALPTVA